MFIISVPMSLRQKDNYKLKTTIGYSKRYHLKKTYESNYNMLLINFYECGLSLIKYSFTLCWTKDWLNVYLSPDGTGVHHSSQSKTQFQAYKLLSSGIFIQYFELHWITGNGISAQRANRHSWLRHVVTHVDTGLGSYSFLRLQEIKSCRLILDS